MLLTIELPPRCEQLAFNRRRWLELLEDETLARLPYKIETNAYGQVLMNPPATGDHSYLQSTILLTLRELLQGQPLTECPVSTVDGVKAVDVAWYSLERFQLVKGQPAFEVAPEICVEVISPSNVSSEMKHKRKLYFEAGAREVWFCEQDGSMAYYLSESADTSASASSLCPDFPHKID